MWGFSLSPEAFKINKDSGLVTSRRRLQSYERFNLTVVATDKGHPPLWGTTMLHIEVIDINDNRPVFVRPPNGTILHIKEVNPWEGAGSWHVGGVFRGTPACNSKIQTPSPLGMQPELDLACGKRVWVMGVEVPKQPLSIRVNRVVGQIWGTETPAALRISKQSVRADPVYKHGLEMLTLEMLLLSGKPGLTQPVPSACLSQSPATQTLPQPVQRGSRLHVASPLFCFGWWELADLQTKGFWTKEFWRGRGSRGFACSAKAEGLLWCCEVPRTR